MLKVNPKCGFAQYNGPKTYKYNYYVFPKYGVNCSLLCFVFLRDQILYHVKYLPKHTVHWPCKYENHRNSKFCTLQSNIFKFYSNVLIFTTTIFIIEPVFK